MKKDSGITLIALAVTIIVLLIIASVSVYSGIDSMKDAKENQQISELNMMRQAVVENYTKYLETQDLNVTQLEKKENADRYLVGIAVAYEEVEEIKNEIDNTIQLKQDNYGTIKSTKQPEYYYRLSAEDLETLKIAQLEDTYIVNYKTGEVMNETQKISKRGTPLYTYAVETSEGENTINFITKPWETYDEQKDILIGTLPDGFTIAKYKWTNLLKEPSTFDDATDLPASQIVPLPSDSEGNYYLWVYAKNPTTGEEIINYSGGYLIKTFTAITTISDLNMINVGPEFLRQLSQIMQEIQLQKL